MKLPEPANQITMRIAVEGCAHGDLENIYDTIHLLEEKNEFKVDLLICCGDFQSSRNQDDLMCMAVPPKYQHICTFYKYYSGEKVAPVLTIFIGGNHEASNYLQELPYGGWVAPNIYYLGYAGVINVAGIRIAGLSGIYKSADYLKGHYEKPPYSEQSKRSVYHVRNLEVFRLKQLSSNIDIFLSHDWPTEVVKFGNVKQLLKRKPLFREDIEKGDLGSKPCNDLLFHLKPSYWFSAHLHCKYPALVKHSDKSLTRFLALDKCLPKRRFLQLIEIPHNKESNIEISHDLEWLTVLYLTNHLLSVKSTMTYMPGPGCNERYNFTPTEDEKNHVLKRFSSSLVVPKAYYKTAPAYTPNSSSGKSKQRQPALNPQTSTFCETLHVDDPIAEVCKMEGSDMNVSVDLNSSISFLDDTLDTVDSLNSSQSTPIKKLINLSLPDPKIDDSEDSKIDDDEDLECKDVPTANNEDSQEEKQSINADLETSKVEDKKEGAAEVNACESPTPKKLKRRNMELYKTDSDKS